MSLATHISMLEEKHYRLESMTDEESARPMPDFTVIQTLKKQKLAVKEELARLNDAAQQRESGGAA
jgi:hypothetical protein